VENTRLGPKAYEPRHVGAALSPERHIVLSALRRSKSPIRVRDLADQLGLHENTIREHFEGLVESAYAERVQLVSSGRGRPSYGYRAREDFVAQIEPEARDYASLALVLARQLAKIGADPRQIAISAGEEWAKQYVDPVQKTSEGKIAIRKRIIEILESLGYSPRSNAKRNIIRLRTCPLLSAAQLEPEIVCSVHLGLVRGLIVLAGQNPDEVKLIQFAEPGNCRLVVP
jgi:predicted ArsR family transcriptional regulator